MLLGWVILTAMRATWVSPVNECGPKGHTKRRKLGVPVRLGSFLWLGLQMVRQNRAIFCRICRKDVIVLTHGHRETLRRFQGSKQFPRDQRLRLKTPGWEVLDYEGNAMSPAEMERQREKIMRVLWL